MTISDLLPPRGLSPSGPELNVRHIAVPGKYLAAEDNCLYTEFSVGVEWDPRGRRRSVKGKLMKRAGAERYRDIDFARAKRGAVVKPEPGKRKISIRLDNEVIEFFRTAADRAGGGNYQTMINNALLERIHRTSTLEAVRQVVREELAPYGRAGAPDAAPRTRSPRR